MADYKHGASATVRLIVEIDVGSSWGGDCTAAQIFKQAEEEARGTIRHMVENYKDHRQRVRVVGVPVVDAVIARREAP